jgi:hypothetical protein
MSIAEIVVFAACWLVVATLLLWGVFSETTRSRSRNTARRPHGAGPVGWNRRSSRPRTDWHPSGQGPVINTDWVVVETAAGSTPEVLAEARLVATALLASRGLDMGSMPPSDIRIEVTASGDGFGTTRVLVRAGAMHASRRRR